MNTLKLATPDLTGQDAVALILDAAAFADESEVPGLALALRAVLHMDERDAASIIDEERGEVEAKAAAEREEDIRLWDSQPPPQR
jgi:hypothetical protein